MTSSNFKPEEKTMTWTPQPISDVVLAFPASVRDLMPPHDECTKALKQMPDRGKRWLDFQNKWFFEGIKGDVTVKLRDGIDGDQAFRHLAAIQGSYEPKHEHKEAAVAYLASLWFVDPPAAKTKGLRRAA